MASSAAVSAVSALGLVLLLTLLTRAAGTAVRTPDQAVALGVQGVGVLVLLWYLATAIVAFACALSRATGRVWTAAEHRLARLGAPLARRLLLTGGSAAVVAVTTLSPAVAAPLPLAFETPPASALALVDDLGWGADPSDEGAGDAAGEESLEPTGSEQPAETDGDEEPTFDPVADSTAPEQYTVIAGDSLWNIAARHLPEASTNADIAAAWPQWYEQNRGVIGDNPDLIHPGQVLTSPGPDFEEEV